MFKITENLMFTVKRRKHISLSNSVQRYLRFFSKMSNMLIKLLFIKQLPLVPKFYYN